MEPRISWVEIVLRLSAAVLVGAVLGLNRELQDKPAGLKTHILVSVGAATVTLSAIEIAWMSGQPDSAAMARVVQGVITGIGFLGAGVILRDSSGKNVRGLTTAATIWLTACIGVSCGAGQWSLILTATAMALAVLLLGGPIERVLYRKVKGQSPRDDQPEG